MYNLSIELILKDTSNQIFSTKDLYRYLEFLCDKFINQVNVVKEFDDMSKSNKCYSMSCYTIKNGISWNILCDSYAKALELVQGIFRLETIEIQGNKLEVRTLDMKEIIENEKNKVIDFVSA